MLNKLYMECSCQVPVLELNPKNLNRDTVKYTYKQYSTVQEAELLFVPADTGRAKSYFALTKHGKTLSNGLRFESVDQFYKWVSARQKDALRLGTYKPILTVNGKNVEFWYGV